MHKIFFKAIFYSKKHFPEVRTKWLLWTRRLFICTYMKNPSIDKINLWFKIIIIMYRINTEYITLLIMNDFRIYSGRERSLFESRLTSRQSHKIPYVFPPKFYLKIDSIFTGYQVRIYLHRKRSKSYPFNLTFRY